MHIQEITTTQRFKKMGFHQKNCPPPLRNFKWFWSYSWGIPKLDTWWQGCYIDTKLLITAMNTIKEYHLMIYGVKDEVNRHKSIINKDYSSNLQ